MNGHDIDCDATVIVRQQPFAHGQPPRARLVCLDKFLGEGLNELEIVLIDHPQSLGRGAENTVQLKYNTLSREHARIVPENSRWVIEDLNSSNGVFVNDEKIARHILTPGDIVKLASLSFRFVYDPLPQTTQIASAATPTIAPPDDEDITLYGAPADAATLRDDDAFAVPLSSDAWAQTDPPVTPTPPTPRAASAKHDPAQGYSPGRRVLILVLSATLAALTACLVLLQTGLWSTELIDLLESIKRLFGFLG